MRLTAGQEYRAAKAVRNFAMNNNDCWGKPRVNIKLDQPKAEVKHQEKKTK